MISETTQVRQFHRLRSVSVVGGFLDGMQIEFAEGLNCIIGHRGTGKTTVLEFVRYTLDAFPNGGEGQVCRKRVEGLVKSNLGDGRIRLTIQTKDGLEYIVDRTASGDPIVLTANGQPTDISILSGGIFNADVFSQNEVEDIADSPESQLTLIDTFVSNDINAIQAQIADVQAKLVANGKQIVPTQDAIVKLADELGTLPSVEAKIAGLAGAGGENAEEINQSQVNKAMREREWKAFADVGKLLSEYISWLSGGTGQFSAKVEGLFSEDVLSGPNGALLQKSLGRLRLIGTELDRLFREGEALLADEQRKQALDVDGLRTAHDAQELAFRDLITKYQEAQGQATERAKWESARNDLIAKQRQHKELSEKLDRRNKQRQELVDQLADLYDKRFELRAGVTKRITDEVSSPIRVRIEQDGNRDRYFNLLVDALKTAQLHHKTVARKISLVLSPAELVEAVRRGDVDELKKHAELNDSQAPKAIAALAEPETLLALETVELADLPKIELQDGEEWKDSLSLSTGQKCTTILPILLMESENPLLIDQPEDNLDNRFIYDTVVDSIRRVKSSRQIVFITHNPNIPVLGDAGGVFVLTSDGVQSRLLNSGGVDDCKMDIINLLEGGEDAFVQRKERYNY